MRHDQIELRPEELLAAICNNLKRHFFEVPKNEAKSRFRDLQGGKAVAFLKIDASAHGEVSCQLALDHSQFVGNLNFSQFRNALAMHLRRIAGKLKNKEDLNIFTSKETGDMIFHIPGVVDVGGAVNILVTGVEQRKAGSLTIRLIFLDPALVETGDRQALGETAS